MSNGFQTAVNDQPARGVAGDFASRNPYFSVDAGPAGIVAAPGGCYVGRFAWLYAPADGDGAPAQASNVGLGSVAGFVHREQQALISDYLAIASMKIPQGFGMTLMNGGDFWCVNDGAAAVLPGAVAYANLADGKVTFGALSGVATGDIAPGTALDAVGSIVNDLLTLTVVNSGLPVNGALLTGSGVASGTRIVRQLSGTAHGAGTYAVSIPGQNVPAGTAIAATYGVFTAASGLTGTFSLGSILTGTGVDAGNTITEFGTGAGGLGTYYTSISETVGSTAITGTLNVATKWKAMSFAGVGELVKISDHYLG